MAYPEDFFTTMAPEGGSARLPEALRREIELNAFSRREWWPKLCPSCGESWRPRKAHNRYATVPQGHDREAKRCPSCRATKPAKRRTRSAE